MRILLIEDDRKFSASIAKHLRAESYAVDIAYDGRAGENLVMVNEYDLILLDIMMPLQDGWTTCANIRKAKIPTPILMLTALDDVHDKIHGLDCGADDYLPKPFHTGELLARIRALVRRPSEIKSATCEQFGIHFDIRTHRTFRDGKEILLSSKEFALLEYFMMNPNVIVSKKMIAEHLWDMNFEPRSNVVESFVRLLRNKIDKDFPVSLIHTVRGSGYILTDRRT
jgi:DNA-binding response OmpR family regulator